MKRITIDRFKFIVILLGISVIYILINLSTLFLLSKPGGGDIINRFFGPIVSISDVIIILAFLFNTVYGMINLIVTFTYIYKRLSIKIPLTNLLFSLIGYIVLIVAWSISLLSQSFWGHSDRFFKY